jgi:hypothetical protein
LAGTPQLAQADGDKTMSQNASEWLYDEASLRLAKPLFDAEIQLGREALIAAPLAALPPVPVWARIGNLSTEFAIARRHVIEEIGPYQERSDYIWHCVDYNRMRFRDGRADSEVSAAELKPELWSAADRALIEGLKTFNYLGPQRGFRNFFHFIGARRGSMWHARQFRSLGGTLYRGFGLTSVWARHTIEDTPAPDDGWRFMPLPAPRLINAAGESVTHDGIANDPDFDPDTTPHHFVYDGKLGRYRIPVAFYFPYSSNPRPRVWRVDCSTFEIRPGHARDRNHPAPAGAARFSETEWTALEQTLISAFFNWPRTPATGYRPLWIEFDRGYHKGVWGTRHFAVGWDNAVTGLSDVPE